MKHRPTSIAAGLLLVSIAAAGLYWLLLPQPILVETAEVVMTTFQDTIEEDGRTRVRDRYMVSAPLSGRVQRLILKAGDVVHAGQKLATITPPVSPLLDSRVRQELEAQVGAAEAGVEEAEAIHEQAKVLLAQASTDLERTRQLAQRNVAAAAQLEREQALFQSAGRQADAAERRSHAATHVLEQARAALQSAGNPDPGEGFPVLSPIDGRVLRVEQESESVVSLAAPLVELGDPGDLEVAVDVLTTEAARIRQGDKVTIARWGGPSDLQGVVRRVEPSGFTKISALGVEEQRVWVIIDIVSPRQSWTNLGDGYRVEVSIAIDQIDKANVLPMGALFRRGDAWSIFVVDQGRAYLREIEVTRRSARFAVAQGIRPGEMVVVYPPASLADGSKIRVQ
ncbi:efflux RND transporter periplasmic adaptor subunit [Mesorhizobium sp.]|jgi:HlyD family secretion protein|uniref:efflux RND transporter periplasmic adaptor subunit n=1 Tax=Mesorhizobium sp. TaxID=1871066 RepID=UPI000FE374D1|nr:efflux RND transporter periplasmic adaptor subunit [Mesorhizobium sp.]RWH73519.1 MAG: efflux RND transporter periplasmic adaptor subunit [Mesorhizobium sp.]RWL31354.1 MAG: efflux RND transporter periplasmic adaptor subunit [Mesorhizobium sp.]RWL36585.1 MAG: efflux RND transporter periplasmic adaptor subunit [Mesorhizobium sp.]RWL40655.1 MAG: efflux RND transporter periplasmic adaptor subunit [Mesorhizobium sp.]RWL58736.1 MAG: efflux RND transporter periplasmic adaptor subunit [Mesorhizobium